MKKLLTILTAAGLIIFASCSKDKGYDSSEYGLNPTDLNGRPIVQILEGGLVNYGAQVLAADIAKAKDTSRFTIAYFDKDLPASEDVSVTIAYDAAALTKYNAANPSTQFSKLPDSTYSIPKTTIIVKKGQKLSPLVDIVTFPLKIDGSKLYMLPITITSTSVSNAVISGNNSTIYYHIIGNPLAGKYNVVGTRYNYNAGPIAWVFPAPYPTPTNTVNITATNPVKTASAVDGQTIALDIANIGIGVLDYQYLITADASFANISLDYNSVFLAADQVKFSKVVSYNFIGSGTAANPKPTFQVITHYNNAAAGTGNDRIMDETFTHQ
jgi:hypothetical protein